jgi:hypothetical protein
MRRVRYRRLLAGLITVLGWALLLASPQMKEVVGAHVATVALPLAQEALRRIRLRLLR